MYRHDAKEVEGRFAKYASVALAAAAIEYAIDDDNAFADLHACIRAMLDNFWRLIAEPMVEGRTTKMTEAEVRSLPSSRLYLHTRRLGELCSELEDERAGHRKAADLANGVLAALQFVVWQLESIEGLRNPGKPATVPCDIAETNWSALPDSLELLAQAARDPDRAFAWQRQTIAQLAQDHPYTPGLIGAPVSPAYFGLALRARTEPALPALDTEHRLHRDEVEDRFAEYALIALVTATIEQLLPVTPLDVAPALSTLINDLWSWQADPKSQGRRGMSAAEAATLPAYRFHARVNELPEHPTHLIGVVRNALLFITWVMDAIERRLNPGKPALFNEDNELEDDVDVLLGVLEQAVDASRDPAAMLDWERQAVLGLRTSYPADPDSLELTLGEPVTREAFERATRGWSPARATSGPSAGESSPDSG